MDTFMPKAKNEEDLQELQLAGLRWTANHAYSSSALYKERLDSAGIHPNNIRSLDDLQKLPFTTARDLQEGYPYPLLSVPLEQVVRIHASSGTTGKRKVLCYTSKDVEDWANMMARAHEMAGIGTEDRVQISAGYGVWTAGIGFELGCERVGALAIPIGPGNMDMQCQFLMDFQTTTIHCTASMGLLLAEEIDRRGIKDKIALSKMTIGSERSSDALRRRIIEVLEIKHLFDVTGMTELYGPGTGIDCLHHTGIHYWADYFILEILDPETLKPVPEGEIGEMVVTTLRKEAVPLLRYRTRDLTRLIPEQCPCGSVLPRHDRLMGRSDDMIIFRAVNIYPGQIDHVLSGIQGIGSEFQVFLERKGDGKDYMTLKVERDTSSRIGGERDLQGRIRGEIKKQILVSADVELVEYGSLPRSERKTKRFFDQRD